MVCSVPQRFRLPRAFGSWENTLDEIQSYILLISIKNTGCSLFVTQAPLSQVIQCPARGGQASSSVHGAGTNHRPPDGSGVLSSLGSLARLTHLGQGHQTAQGSEASTVSLRGLRLEKGPAAHSNLWGGASLSHPRQDTWLSYSDADTKQIHTKPDKPFRQGCRREQTRTREQASKGRGP